MFRTLILRELPIPVQRSINKYPHFDLCVIGGGPGGIAGAVRATAFGKKVCIVESRPKLGGADLWGGTVPSKTLWEIAKSIYRMSNSAETGRFLEPSLLEEMKGKISSERIMKSVHQASEAREDQLEEYVRAAGIEVIQGKASFANEREVDIYAGKGEYNTVTSDYFLIATGSVPREHPLFPCDHKLICNVDDIFKLPIPKSIVIIGAGPMGCEFAAMFANLGTVKVHLVDKDERILPSEDEDLSDAVRKGLEDRGVIIHRGSQLFDIEIVEDPKTGEKGIHYSIQNMKTERLESATVERALVAVGRKSFYGGLGLENLKVHVKNGILETDHFYRCTPYNHIYCVGDASSKVRLVTMAQVSARHAIQSMYGATPLLTETKTLPNMSTGWFFDEEVAAIGLNEKQCREHHIGYIVAKHNYSHLTRGIVSGQTNGFVKLIVSNDREKRVLGVRALGMHSGSVVEIVSLAIRDRSSVYDLLRLNPAYPAIAIGLVECARMLVGRGSRQSNTINEVTLRQWTPDHFTRGRAFYEEEKESAEEK